MNIDLLKKLVRLATNNPNNNEANLAARRVCKMLIEDDFKCLNNQYQPPLQGKSPIQSPNTTSKSSITYEDILNDLFRGRDTYYAQRPPPTWEPPRYEPPKQPKPRTTRTCSECDAEVVTSDNSLNFICAVCKWARYNKGFSSW